MGAAPQHYLGCKLVTREITEFLRESMSAIDV
jgi:hypothetical protein